MYKIKSPRPLRVQKFWQGQEPFIVCQCQIRDQESNEPAKSYLIIDARSDSSGVYLTDKKPQNLNPAGALVTRIRKIAKTAAIVSIKADQKRKNFALSFSAKEKIVFSIHLEKIRPSVIHFLDESSTKSVARLSSRGTYTKHKDALSSIDEPLKDWADILEEFQFSKPSKITALESPQETQIKVQEFQKTLIGSLKRRLKTVKKSHEKMTRELPSYEDIKRQEEEAGLLQSFAYLAKKDDDSIHIPSFLSGRENDLTIIIDPEKSVGQNIDLFFNKVRKSQRKLEISTQKIEELEKSIHELQGEISRLRSTAISIDDSHLVRQRFGLKTPQKTVNRKDLPQATPYNTYIYDGAQILVGKGAKENDVLAKKAKANDYWLHAIGTTGSHIIVPARKQSEELDPKIKKAAAILAIHFSKYRADLKGEVYYTRKAHIKKRKGMPAGLWTVERSESYYVKYDHKELKSILDSKIT